MLRPAGFDIVDEAGAVLLSHEWPQAADDAVTELTRIFGDEPVVSEEPGDAIWPGRRTYAWPGFELRDALEPTADYAFASGLYVTVAAVNSIDVRTEAGLAVGSTFDDVATVGFVHEMTIDGHHGFLLAEAGPGGEQGSYKLAGGGEAASGILTSFSVPVAWGA